MLHDFTLLMYGQDVCMDPMLSHKAVGRQSKELRQTVRLLKFSKEGTVERHTALKQLENLPDFNLT